MSLYKRGGVWWYKFQFKGLTIRESSGLSSKDLARDVERKRALNLKEGNAGIVRPKSAQFFAAAADAWLEMKRDEWAPKTCVIERTNLEHLKPAFGSQLLSDISPDGVAAYRSRRLHEKASDKTTALELGTLRAVMLFHDYDAQWRMIRKKVKPAKARNIGRVVTRLEEAALLDACRQSRSRALHVVVTVALQTCMRSSEIRLLQWRQVDFSRRVLAVGKSKTSAGSGREIPLTASAFETLRFWAANFPDKKLSHFVFPQEWYGGQGKDRMFGFAGRTAYGTDPTQPVGSWKEAWEEAKKRAGVECRFHDLRHTGCTRLLEAGVSHPIVAEIMGWSASTTIRMIKEVYGHVGLGAKRQAMDQLERAQNAAGWAQNWAQSEKSNQVKAN